MMMKIGGKILGKELSKEQLSWTQSKSVLGYINPSFQFKNQANYKNPPIYQHKNDPHQMLKK